MANDSGIGTYIRNVVPRVIRARPQWRFTLLGAPETARELGWDHLPAVEMRPCRARIYTPAEQLELARTAPRDADLFWSPHYNIPLLYRGALAVTVHDVGHLVLPEFDRIAVRAYARVMLGTVRRRARVLLFNSRYTRGDFIRHVGQPSAVPRVIHLGVGDEWREARPAAEPPSRPYVVFVGNLKPHKNIAGLIAAFKMMCHTVPHDLVIVGRREGMRTVDQSVQHEAAALGDRVRITGELPADELRATVAGADLLVMPSLFEGFGLPPLEAMAAGCPTLVARAASLPEVCGDASAYCDPHDVHDIAAQLAGLLGDPARRAELRQRGRAHAARFTWERAAADTAQALEQAIG